MGARKLARRQRKASKEKMLEETMRRRIVAAVLVALIAFVAHVTIHVSTNHAPEDFREFLDRLDLSRHERGLSRKVGATAVDDLLEMREADWALLGMKALEARRVVKQVAGAVATRRRSRAWTSVTTAAFDPQAYAKTLTRAWHVLIGWTPLHFAAEQGDAEEVRKLLLAAGLNVNGADW
jgi:hypothetical protein